MFRLDDKKALVTGATGGIGRAIAHALVNQGVFVVLSGTNPDRLKELKKEFPSDTCAVIACDLSQHDDVSQLFDKAEEICGQIDILVNNAGITRDGLAMRMKDSEWENVLNVNLGAAFRLCRSAVKQMLRRKSGRIINISSVVGVMGNAGQINYVASKAGLIGLTKSLAAETASRNITVNAIAPGFIQTPMTDILSDAQKDRIKGGIPAGKLGQPEDIAASVVYLASDEASYMTGQTLHLNGGMYMG